MAQQRGLYPALFERRRRAYAASRARRAARRCLEREHRSCITLEGRWKSCSSTCPAARRPGSRPRKRPSSTPATASPGRSATRSTCCAAACSGAPACSRGSRCIRSSRCAARCRAGPGGARRRSATRSCSRATGRSAPTAAGQFPLDDLTREHIVPTSRGGGDTWMNCITACRACNGHKGNRLPGRGAHVAALPALRAQPARGHDPARPAHPGRPDGVPARQRAAQQPACTAELRIRHGGAPFTVLCAACPRRAVRADACGQLRSETSRWLPDSTGKEKS